MTGASAIMRAMPIIRERGLPEQRDPLPIRSTSSFDKVEWPTLEEIRERNPAATVLYDWAKKPEWPRDGFGPA